jgi:4-carboxymuconolactone decarboxylase
VTSALGSGDITYEEMEEVALQFSAYSGFPKGEVLQAVASQWKAANL